jgi:hypothetical protein
MKWIRPSIGEKRTVKKFAWFPVDLSHPSRKTIWLESYFEDQFYNYYLPTRCYEWIGGRMYQI